MAVKRKSAPIYGLGLASALSGFEEVTSSRDAHIQGHAQNSQSLKILKTAHYTQEQNRRSVCAFLT